MNPLRDLAERFPHLALAALVAVNALPLLGVLLWGWDLAQLLVLYWAENLIIGGYTVLKMLQVGKLGGLFASAFFSFHYGGFCAVHGLFVVGLTQFGGGSDSEVMNQVFPSTDIFLPFIFFHLLGGVLDYVAQVAPPSWWWLLGALVFSHGVSYLVNFIGHDEMERTTVKDLMGQPYGRVVLLHISIIAGGFAVIALGEPLGLLLVLVVLKTAMDVVMHRREHRKAQAQQQAVALEEGAA